MASGILGNSDLSANTNTTVYTVPADTYSVVTVNFCNRGSNTANIRLATRLFLDGYERPGKAEADYPQRLKFAKQTLETYG